ENKIIKDFGLGKEGKGKRDARESEELVLRFFAFFESPEAYEGNLSKFLDKYMKNASSYSFDKLEVLKNNFNNALDACLIVFSQDEVFSDISRDRRRQGVVYYDLLMTTLGKIKHSVIKKKRTAIRSAFIELCKSDSFKRSTAGGLQRKSSVNKRN